MCRDKLLISVLVSCYNRSDVIQRALKSLLTQTYKDFEVIIVDDCSTDDSINVINLFKDENPHLVIRVVSLKKNMGQSATKNVAISLAQGEVVTFLDSDDVYQPTFLEIVAAPLLVRNNKDGFRYCRFTNGKKWTLSGKNKFKDVLKQGYLSGGGSIAVKKDVIREILPLPERKIPNDMCEDDWICYELARISSFTVVRKSLYTPIGTNKTSTSDKGALASGHLMFFRSYRDDIINVAGQKYYEKHFGKVMAQYRKSSLKSALDFFINLRTILGTDFRGSLSYFFVLVGYFKWEYLYFYIQKVRPLFTSFFRRCRNLLFRT